MHALYVPAAGEPPIAGDLPTPELGEGTVLVRVKAAGLNPIDNGIAAGMLAAMMTHQYPLVLGRDAAGVVAAVGADVDHVKVGDEVLGHVLLAPPVHAGTLAEYVALPAAAVAAKPAELGFAEASALPLAGAAAVAAVDAIDPAEGDVVLVNGASGGVGSFVVQLLAARSVTVIATGTGHDTDRLQSLGATTVVDYTAGPVADTVRAAHPDGVDALINLAGHRPEDVPLAAVRAGGRVATTTMAPDQQAIDTAGLAGSTVMATPTRGVLEHLAEQAARGTLRIDVEQILTLDQAADGLALLANGQARGKIVVTVGQ